MQLSQWYIIIWGGSKGINLYEACISKLDKLCSQYYVICYFLILDPPSAPLCPKFFPESLTSAVLSWISPSDSLCVTSYTITLNKVTQGNTSCIYNTTMNTTSLTVSDLTQGEEYSFIVAGIDVGGRVGENSVPSSVIMLNSKSSQKLIN